MINWPVVLILWVVRSCWSECNCGRGGVCLSYGENGEDGVSATPCHCNVVSKNIMVPAPTYCDRIYSHHCDDKPCQHGTCYTGFGTFICICNHVVEDYVGHKCDTVKPAYPSSNEVTLWFPMTDQKKWVPTITASYLRSNTLLSFEFEYGRRQTFTKDFCRKTTMETTMGKCKKGGGGEDCTILSFVAHRSTHHIDCSIFLPFELKRAVYVKGVTGPFGYYHDVAVLVTDHSLVQLNATYRVFLETGGLMRKCPYTVKLTGCGRTPLTATQAPSSAPLTMSASSPFSDNEYICPVKSKKYKWFLSRLTHYGHSIEVGTNQKVTVFPSKYDLHSGMVTVTVEITFKELVEMEDETIVAMCYVNIYQQAFLVDVSDAYLRYTCGVTVHVEVAPTFTNLNLPEAELTFNWICSKAICEGANITAKILTFETNVPCGITHKLALEVTHSPTSMGSYWEGQFLFASPSEYDINLMFDPGSILVKPMLPLTITARDTLNLTQRFLWFPKIVNYTMCGSGVPSNIFMIPPNTLEPNRNYSFEVVTEKGSKNFTVQTAPEPRNLVCNVHPNSSLFLHVDKYNLSCTAESEYLPLIYYIHEGDKKEIVRISRNPQMTDILVGDPTVWVEVEDSMGMRASTEIAIPVKAYDEIQHKAILRTVPERIERLNYLLHDNDFSGAANEIDRITKLIDNKFPFNHRYALMKLLGRITVCDYEECITKTINSVRRNLGYELDDNYLGYVDDFILHGGFTIYRMVKSLNQPAQWAQAREAYTLIPLLSKIHSAARELMKFPDELLQHPTLNEDTRQFHFRSVEQGNAFARQAIAELGLFIVNHIPHPAFPFELISDLSAEKTTVISHFPSHINCIGGLNESGSNFRFTRQAIEELNLNGYSSSVAIVKYKDEFWWLRTRRKLVEEMIEIHIYKKNKSEKEWEYMTERIGPFMMGTISPPLKVTTVEDQVYVPKIGAKTPEELDPYVQVYRVVVPRGYSALLLVFPEYLLGFVRVITIHSTLPTYEMAEMAPVLSHTLLASGYYSSRPDNNVYIGVLANLGDKAYYFQASLIKCVTWSENLWKSEACYFTNYTEAARVICTCNHLSLISVESEMPAIESVPMVTFHLHTTINKDWYAKLVIVAAFIALFALYCVAYSYEWKTKPKSTAMFLLDNWPGENYPYLLAVYTGGRCMSGTSSHVAIRLIGEGATSRVHILQSDYGPVPLAWGQDCWFILFTAASLGNVQYIEMWHDGAGYTSDWYCTEVIIWDITTKDRFQIPVRMWLSWPNLYKKCETVFRFETIDSTKKRNWWSYVFSHIHAKLRQEHHWISIVLLHPRSCYTRLDRLMLVHVIVMVSLATTMVFYLNDLGPADRPKLKITSSDMLIAAETIIITFIVIAIPAILLSIGRNKLLKGLPRGKSAVKPFFRSLFIHPVTHKPIITQEMSTLERPEWNFWVWSGYVACVVLIYGCVIFMANFGLSFSKNMSIIWLIISLIALLGEALVTNPIQVLVTAVLVAHMTQQSARDIATVSIELVDSSAGVQNESKQLDKMLHNRVKRMYKPPMSDEVKNKATKRARKELLDVFHVTVVSLLLVLIPILVAYLEKELKYHKHQQLSEIFTGEKSSGLNSVRNRTKYFHYLRGTVMHTLHLYNWYNGLSLQPEWEDSIDEYRPTTKYTGYCADYSTKLVGVPQLRQQRVMPDSNKTIAPGFRRYFQHAYDQLELLTEDTKTYLPNWETPKEDEEYYKTYRYYYPDKETKFYGVSRRAYDSGGYIEHLHWSMGISQSILVDLQVDGWLDNLTRTIFFTFNLYSVYEEKISYVTVITECLPSGVYRSRTMAESASVSVERSTSEKVVGFIVLCIAILVTVHLLRTITVISKHGFTSYLKTTSGFIDFSLIFTGYGLLIAFINRYFKFFTALEEIESTPKESYTSLHSRFNQNYIALIFIGSFSLSVTAFGSLLVHNLIGFEAINLSLARTRALLVAFGGINLFAVYVSLSLSYFGSGDVPNLFFLLFFKESTAIQDTLALASYYANILLVAVIAFLILTRLNLAILVHFYAEAASLIEPKTTAIKKKFTSLRSRLQMIQSLKTAERPKKSPLIMKLTMRKKRKEQELIEPRRSHGLPNIEESIGSNESEDYEYWP